MTTAALTTHNVSDTPLLPHPLSDGHCLADNVNGIILMLITQCPLTLACSCMLILTAIWDTFSFDFYKQSAWEVFQANICHFTHHFRDMFIFVKLYYY